MDHVAATVRAAFAAAAAAAVSDRQAPLPPPIDKSHMLKINTDYYACK